MGGAEEVVGVARGVAGISTGIAWPLGSLRKSCSTVAEGDAGGRAGPVMTVLTLPSLGSFGRRGAQDGGGEGEVLSPGVE